MVEQEHHNQGQNDQVLVGLEYDNKDKHFKGQHHNEHFICFFRHHWITLVREFLYFTIFSIFIVTFFIHVETIQEILRGNRELKMLFFMGFLVETLYIHRFFIKLLNYFVNIGIITNIRVIDHQKTVFFRDTLDSIDMAQIQNIEKIQDGVLPSLLGFGDIKIFLTASDTVKTFSAVPHSKFHFRCINRQKEDRQMDIASASNHNRVQQGIESDGKYENELADEHREHIILD